MIESGSYDQQIGLMMAGGEKLDLMLTFLWDLHLTAVW